VWVKLAALDLGSQLAQSREEKDLPFTAHQFCQRMRCVCPDDTPKPALLLAPKPALLLVPEFCRANVLQSCACTSAVDSI
jgi:hypothetical protein